MAHCHGLSYGVPHGTSPAAISCPPHEAPAQPAGDTFQGVHRAGVTGADAYLAKHFLHHLLHVQAVQEESNHLLGSVLGALLTYYPTDQFRPTTGLPRASEEELEVEAWIGHKEQSGDHAMSPRPQWHMPSEQEVATTCSSLFLSIIQRCLSQENQDVH